MCPYETWERGLYHFCEAQRCGWIREPLNTISNLGFLIVGWLIFWRNRKVPQVRIIGLSAILVGLLSGFYHASSSRIGEVLDLGSMFLLVGGLIAFNLQRLGWVSVRVSEFLAVVLAAGALSLLLAVNGTGRTIFDSLIQLTLFLELLIYIVNRRKGSLNYSYRYLLAAFACHLSAWGFWYLDHERIVCSPESLLFQGHALWHLLGAGTFICLTRFYLQFQTLRFQSPANR